MAFFLLFRGTGLKRILCVFTSFSAFMNPMQCRFFSSFFNVMMPLWVQVFPLVQCCMLWFAKRIARVGLIPQMQCKLGDFIQIWLYHSVCVCECACVCACWAVWWSTILVGYWQEWGMCETSPQISLFLLFLSHFLSPFFPLGLHTHTHTQHTLTQTNSCRKPVETSHRQERNAWNVIITYLCLFYHCGSLAKQKRKPDQAHAQHCVCVCVRVFMCVKYMRVLSGGDGGGWVGVEGIEWEGKEWAIWQCTWVCGWCVGVRVSGCRALFEWEHMWLEVCVGVECVCVERWKVLRARARVCAKGEVIVCFRVTFAERGGGKKRGKKKKLSFLYVVCSFTHMHTHTHSSGACQTQCIPERSNTQSLNGGMNAGKFSWNVRTKARGTFKRV